MKVIFIQDVPGVARAGEVKEVASGYGRNFLFPQNLAKPATKENLEEIGALRRAEARRRILEEQELTQMARQLEGATVTLQGKAGPRGRLFGSITSADIAQAIEEELKIEIDKRHIELPEPIRELGVFTARIKLTPDLSPLIRIVVKEAPSHDGK